MEIMASYQDSKNDFRWGVDVNFSYSKNKVLEMGILKNGSKEML